MNQTISFLLEVASFHNVFHFDLTIPKWVPNQNPEHYAPKDVCDLQPIFGDLSQSEKSDENKPPLAKNYYYKTYVQ